MEVLVRFVLADKLENHKLPLRDPQRSSVHGQGHLLLDQVAHSPIQPHFELFK